MLQAQTVANFFLAFDQNLAIVPVLNKIDMVSADPDKVAEEMQQVIMHVAFAEAFLSQYSYSTLCFCLSCYNIMCINRP